MNDSNHTEHYSKFDIILASTLFAAALGYLLFKPRQGMLTHADSGRIYSQAQEGLRQPVLIAPLSQTIH